MMTYKEINEFLTSFKPDSYNRSQIGHNKQLVISIYEYLYKLNISKENINVLISNIAYLNKDNLNIPLFLELLSKSIGFMNSYELKDVIDAVKEIHDLYFENAARISLEEYLHDTTDNRLRKLFLNRNNKYLVKNFNSANIINYICDLKLAAAIILDQKDYKEFIAYIDNFEKNQDSYSPLIIFKTYNKVRKQLKEKTLLFWDIFFANEYVVAFNKHSIEITDIYKENIYNKKERKSSNLSEPIQLDLFSNTEEIEESSNVLDIKEDVKIFQFSTIYNSRDLPKFDKEKDLLMYYKKLLDNKDLMTLPKLKNQSNGAFLYDIN